MNGYLRPKSVQEAVAAMAAHPDWLVLAGGTDALVGSVGRARAGHAPAGLIDLWRCPDLCGLRFEGTDMVIGAGTTWRELAQSVDVQRRAAPLAQAAAQIGAWQIQTRGTIGGNIATSSPVGDSLPVLLALDARLRLTSRRGTREVPYASYCTGYRKTVRLADELIEAVVVPAQPEGAALAFRKVGTRQAQAISKVMVATCLVRHAGKFVQARLALGAVADRPLRLTALEAAVVGLDGEAAAARVRAQLPTMIAPITDVRSTADYRLAAATNVLARMLAP